MSVDDAEVLDPYEVMPALEDREPVINRLHDAQRELLFRKLGMHQYEKQDEPGVRYWQGPNGLSVADVAAMLEVAGMYRLDPFAPGEIWVARGKPRDGEPQGKLLLMVGRDGLRKIALNNKLEIDGDVVREMDTFVVEREADRSRTITHRYTGGKVEDRGPVVGAWAEVYERRTGRQRGYFYAPIGEYKPSSPHWSSPWAAQESAMIRKAAERQAISQATPLGGLMTDGEMDLIEENARRGPVLGTEALKQLPEEALDLDPMVASVVARATSLGHWLGDAASAQLQTRGKPEDEVAEWVRQATALLDKLEQPKGDGMPGEASSQALPFGGDGQDAPEPEGPLS